MAERHFRVVARDGTHVGRVEHVVAERGEQRPSGLVIFANGAERVLPLSAVSGSDGTFIRLREDASHYRDLPYFQRSQFRVIDEEMAVAEELDEDFVVGGEEDFSDDAFDLPASAPWR